MSKGKGKDINREEDDVVVDNERLAENGDIQAQINLAHYYLKEGQELKMAEYLLMAAQKGHANSQCNIGMFYQKTGKYKEALDFFKKAAEQGHIVAKFKVGELYLRGQGVDVDHNEAKKYFRTAAKQGHINSQYGLALLSKEDDEEYFKWLKKTAKNSIETDKGKEVYDGQYSLRTEAQMLLSQYCHMKENFKEAKKWYKRLVKDEHADAMNNLGILYCEGKGVEQDYKKAIKYFRKAAEQESVHAQYNLGLRYENGEGVKKNLKKAKKYYRKAAEGGYEFAQRKLDFIEESLKKEENTDTFTNKVFPNKDKTKPKKHSLKEFAKKKEKEESFIST